MPMIPLITPNNQESYGTASSYPTGVMSGVLGNALSVVMANHPGITAEDAMTLIVENYLIEKTFQYKDETTNWKLVDGGYWYFLDMEKLLKAELLKEKQLNGIALNKEQVELPHGQGICYMGKGILLEYKGKTYETTEANQALLTEALKSGDIRWYWNKTIFQKYSTTSSATFDVYVVDKLGQKIPDTHLSITKNIE